MNSNNISTPSSPAREERFSLGILGAAALGFTDAAYLAAEHYRGEIPPCSIVNGCERVLTSEYAAILGIPVALLGAFFYLAVFLLTIAYREAGSPQLLRYLMGLAALGFLATLGFLHLQFFVLKAICFYCLVSAGTSTLIFVLALLLLRRPRSAAAA